MEVKYTKLRFIQAHREQLEFVLEQLREKIEIKQIIKLDDDMREVWFTVLDKSAIKSMVID